MYQKETISFFMILVSFVSLSSCGNVGLSKADKQSLNNSSGTSSASPIIETPKSPYVNCNRQWNHRGVFASILDGHGLTTDISWYGQDVYINAFLQNSAQLTESFAVYKKNSNQLLQLNKPRPANCSYLLTGGFLSSTGLGTLLMCDASNTIKTTLYNPSNNTWSTPEEYSVYQLHFDSNGVAHGLFNYWDASLSKNYYQIRKRTDAGWVNVGQRLYQYGVRDFFFNKTGEIYFLSQTASPDPRLIVTKHSDLTKLDIAIPNDALIWTNRIQYDQFNEKLQLALNSNSLSQNIFYEFDIKNKKATEVLRSTSTNTGIYFGYLSLTNGEVVGNQDYARIRVGTPSNFKDVFDNKIDKIDGISPTIYNMAVNDRGDIAAIMTTYNGASFKYRIMTYECAE